MPKPFTPEEIANHKENILLDISVKNMSLHKACKQSGYPANVTVYEWLKEDKDFANNYARACEVRHEAMADDILEICDATENDIIRDLEGNEITNNNVIQRDKLRVDTRKWLLSKLMPKKYGDKIDVTSGGEEIKQTPTINIIAPKE